MTIHVYGAGGLGREVLAVLQATNQQASCFLVDPGFAASDIRGVPVRAARLEDARDPGVHFVLAVGNGRARQRAAASLGADARYLSVIHPAATIGPFVSLGEGVMVIGPASITTDVEVGAHALINPGCTIAHDCVLGAFCNLSPSVALAGRVTIQEGANLGVGVTVKPGVVIGAWSNIGAGAVVIRDVEPGSTVAGVPARPIRRRSPHAPDPRSPA